MKTLLLVFFAFLIGWKLGDPIVFVVKNISIAAYHSYQEANASTK